MARASSDLSQLRLILAMLPITLANLTMFVVVALVLVIIDPGPRRGCGADGSRRCWSRRPASPVGSSGYSFDLQQRLSELSHVVEESVTGIEVVKSYGQEDQQQRASRRRRPSLIYDSAMDMARERADPPSAVRDHPGARHGGGARRWRCPRVVDGAITIGQFVSFTQYLAVMVLPLMITGWFFANLPRSAAAATRIDDLLETDPDIREQRRPRSTRRMVRVRSGSGTSRSSIPGSTEVLRRRRRD